MIEDDTFIFQASMRDFLLQFDPQQKHYLGYPTRGVSQCREPTKPSQQESTGQTFNLTQMHNQQQLANVSTTSTSQPQSIRRLLHRLAFRERRHPDTQVLNDAEAFRHGSDRTPSAHVERQQDIKKTFTSQATSEYSLLNQEIATADHAQQQLQSGKSLHAQASTQQTSEEMYALSGGGMILSRGAMASLAPLLKGCMLSSQDCHLDDVRLYLCLKQAGIRLNTSSGYVALNLAPNRNIDWGRFDPCTRPAVIHEVTCFLRLEKKQKGVKILSSASAVALYWCAICVNTVLLLQFRMSDVSGSVTCLLNCTVTHTDKNRFCNDAAGVYCIRWHPKMHWQVLPLYILQDRQLHGCYHILETAGMVLHDYSSAACLFISCISWRWFIADGLSQQTKKSLAAQDDLHTCCTLEAMMALTQSPSPLQCNRANPAANLLSFSCTD